MSKGKDPIRSAGSRQDLGAIPAIKYNDAAGADKMAIVELAFTKTTLAGENVGAGKLVKISATPYTLELKGKTYDAGGAIYQIGDITTSGGFVYLAKQDGISGAFDASKWTKKATTTVVGIVSTVGSVVSTGRWHNSVSVAGWLADDDSSIKHTRIRD